MDAIGSGMNATPIPRSPVAVGVDPDLRPSLRSLAGGRVLVIDSFRSWQCGTWVGDLTVAWRDTAPGPDFAELAPIDDVRLFANRRLLRLLRDGGAVLRRGGLPFRRGLGVNLERPELWIDYLEHPSSFGLPAGGTGVPSEELGA
jgi:hypothetical protein